MKGLRSPLTGAAIAALAWAMPLTAAYAAGAAVHNHAQGEVVDIVRLATDLPGPIPRRGPQTLTVDMETIEVTGQLEDGSSYHYWTFNGKVPGPFVRVRVGDTVKVRLKNDEGSAMMHNVDFHAVTGPHGGGAATMAAPGETKGFTFKALSPGLYVYHCATPVVSQHIANGMYGMILVEPEEGLSKVDHEFYVMQGELYTEQANGTKGLLTESIDKLMAELPEYYVMNGAAGGLSGAKAMKVKTGESVRVFFGVGGPNKASSFHVIGEIFDKAYPLASITSDPWKDVQTLMVPPGGATVTELKFDVPGNYVLVDHALSRVDKGAKAMIEAVGPQRADIFKDDNPEQVAHSGH